jgi:hypothetical protein
MRPSGRIFSLRWRNVRFSDGHQHCHVFIERPCAPASASGLAGAPGEAKGENVPARPEMRLPYGPGWEDPDWTPHEPPAAPEPAQESLPCVSTLSQFMAVVKRAAAQLPQAGLRVAPIERRHPVAGTAAYVGQTRRWVIAGGAGLLAISTIPALPRGARAPAEEEAQGEAGEESVSTTGARGMPGSGLKT